MARLAKYANGFEPPEYFLNTFALTLAHRISGMTSCPTVDRASPTGVASAGNMRCHVTISTRGDKLGGVVSFVGTKRDAAAIRNSVHELKSRFAFRKSAGNCQRRLCDETIWARAREIEPLRS